MRLDTLAAGALLAAAVFSGGAAGQEFPQQRPIHIVIPTGPGSTSDVLGRLVGQKLSETLAVAVVPENRPGALGNIAAQQVKRSAPDGHTLLVHSVSLLINATLYAAPGYAPGEFVPVAIGPRTPTVIVVHPSVPAGSLGELIALARTTPLAYASSGSGSTTHLSMERLKRLTGADITHVPHQPAQAIAAAVGGHVPIASTSMPPAVPQVRAGKLKAIAVSSAARSRVLPDVPTIAESGFPGFDETTWFAFFAPAATPASTVERLNREINRIFELPDVREKLAQLGLEFTPNTATQAADYVRSEAPKWAQAVKDSGAKAD